jgi:hypothetical protein
MDEFMCDFRESNTPSRIRSPVVAFEHKSPPSVTGKLCFDQQGTDTGQANTFYGVAKRAREH